MNRETLKALKGSIRKWEKIVDGTGVDMGYENCPLCDLFARPYSAISCSGCPVAEAGAPNCAYSPYQTWVDHAIANDQGQLVVDDNDSAIAAVLELEFLRSLLPEAK